MVGSDWAEEYAGRVLYTFHRQGQAPDKSGFVYDLYLARSEGGFHKYPGLVTWPQIASLAPDPFKLWPDVKRPSPAPRRRQQGGRTGDPPLQPVAEQPMPSTPVARPRERRRTAP